MYRKNVEEIKVYFKDLSPRVQNKLLNLRDISQDIIENNYPVTIIFPEEVTNYLDDWDMEEFDDEFTDYGKYNSLDLDNLDDDYEDDYDEDYDYDLSYCDDDCETCKKVRCEERGFHGHDLDW